jgi:hypothetical protein
MDSRTMMLRGPLKTFRSVLEDRPLPGAVTQCGTPTLCGLLTWVAGLSLKTEYLR